MTAALLAHQGGWDEILLVLLPIALFGLLLVVANRRANVIESRRDGDDAADGPAPAPSRNRRDRR